MAGRDEKTRVEGVQLRGTLSRGDKSGIQETKLTRIPHHALQLHFRTPELSCSPWSSRCHPCHSDHQGHIPRRGQQRGLRSKTACDSTCCIPSLAGRSYLQNHTARRVQISNASVCEIRSWA